MPITTLDALAKYAIVKVWVDGKEVEIPYATAELYARQNKLHYNAATKQFLYNNNTEDA